MGPYSPCFKTSKHLLDKEMGSFVHSISTVLGLQLCGCIPSTKQVTHPCHPSTREAGRRILSSKVSTAMVSYGYPLLHDFFFFLKFKVITNMFLKVVKPRLSRKKSFETYSQAPLSCFKLQ